MNRLRGVLIALGFGCGLCDATIITQIEECSVYDSQGIPVGYQRQLQSCAVNVSYAGAASGSLSVSFPAVGLYQSPVDLQVNDSVSASYKGVGFPAGYGAQAWVNVDAQTVITPLAVPTGHSFILVGTLYGTESGNLGGWVGANWDITTPLDKFVLAYTFGTNGNNGTCAGAYLTGCTFLLTLPTGPITVEYRQRSIASAGYGIASQSGSSQANLHLQFLLDDGVTPLDVSVADPTITPEPATFMLGLVPLGLLLVERSRRRRG